MEVPPSAVDTPPAVGGMNTSRGGYRGRGGGSGAPMRGSFERGRGRGLGRGHYMGGRGGMGMSGGPPPQSIMSGGRGMRPPRGGPGGYQGRGGFAPRGGPPMRGGRMPLYAQATKQHSGSDNNKTVSPVPSAGTGSAVASGEESVAETGAQVNSGTNSGSSATQTTPLTTSNGTAGGPPSYRGLSRGRGGSFSRGGRGSYNPHNGSIHGMHGSAPLLEHGHVRRGGLLRGRGGYGGGPITRPPLHQQHSANTQIAPLPSLKRGAPGGPSGPKRGRYEGGPYSQRSVIPKYHQPPQHMSSMQQGNYGAPQSHHQSQSQSHHGYTTHDQSQVVDPYGQSYVAPTAQSSYNGYGHNSGYSTHTASATQSNSGYASHAGSEYDQTQYQGYSSSYGTQQDTRYQSYGQDYTQQYGAPAVDYNSTSQADYSHHGQQGYDERAYAGYDTQSYQQSYPNSTGYY